jgi:V/A-type H+-transporting ATPase subunit I
MFSYARIAGFAIAHAAFGLVAAELLHVNPALGIGLGLIFLNFFSLTLELLVVMIQALRLLYYEFSTKFFKGTGVPYIPFRL